MQRHPFDPISAALGALVIVLGVLVAIDALGDAGGGGGWWFALAAAIVGLAILPWRRSRPAGDEPLAVSAEEPLADDVSE